MVATTSVTTHCSVPAGAPRCRRRLPCRAEPAVPGTGWAPCPGIDMGNEHFTLVRGTLGDPGAGRAGA